MIALFVEVMPECVIWQNILLYKAVSCKVAPKRVLLHFKTLDFKIKTIKICEIFHSIEKWNVFFTEAWGTLKLETLKSKQLKYVNFYIRLFKIKCFLYRGMRHVAGKGLQRTWEVKVIVTGACVGISYYDKMEKNETCENTFTFCLSYGWVAWMSLLLSQFPTLVFSLAPVQTC